MSEAAAIVHSGDGRRIWLRQGEHAGIHWADAPGLPRARQHPADLRMPTRGESGHAVTALRGLLSCGLMLAESPRRATATATDAAEWAARFDKDTPRAAEHFADEGWRWRTDRLVPLTRRAGRGDVIRRDTHLYALVPEPTEPVAQAKLIEHGVSELLTAWRGGRVLPDFMPTVLRRLADGELAYLGLDAEQPWEVAPGVRMMPLRSPTLPPAAHTNVFFIGHDEAVLIEPATPFPDEVDRIASYVEEQRDAGVVVRAICATHHHPDHIGGAVLLAKRLALPLWAHALTADRLDGRVRFDRLLEHDEVITLGGDTPMTLRCVHTPGHAPGHLCFHEPESGALVSGDMVAGVGTILVEKHDGDMGLYLESLAAMKALDPSMLLPAHGGVIANPAACLDHYRKHRLAREEKVYAALAQLGEGDPKSIVPIAYDDAPRAAWPLAQRSVEAHLLHLVALGRARQVGKRFEIAS